ncbi:MAG: MBL fold metallo-hydrolase [Oligoflexia bacterium]|nr:MBL fold metallo-hydrolase [Oligoflexia bacterium]
MEALNESPVGLHQFRRDGCYSYLLYDRASREAVVVDPRVDLMPDYRAFVAENGLRPVFAIDTHSHSDHFSATHLFRAEFSSEIAMSAASGCERLTLGLKTGDRVALGNLVLEALETPGHTADSLSLLVRAGGEVKAVFTGDALWIGLSGRVEMGAPGVELLWKSLAELLLPLEERTLVFPAHGGGARGGAGGELLFSTAGAEKRRNPHLKASSTEVFRELKRAEVFAADDPEVRRRLEFNSLRKPGLSAGECQDGGPFGPRMVAVGAMAEESPVSTLQVQKFSQKLESRLRAPSHYFIDVREVSEFRAGRLPGTMNLPLSEIGFHLSSLLNAPKLYFSCQTGRRSLCAARTLSYLGHPDVVNVAGGMQAWLNAGYPLLKN